MGFVTIFFVFVSSSLSEPEDELLLLLLLEDAMMVGMNEVLDEIYLGDYDSEEG
jgi:hypothetical protein